MDELKGLDSDALKKEIFALKKELFNLKLGMVSEQVKDVSQFRKLRVKIARISTYLNNKKNNAKKIG